MSAPPQNRYGRRGGRGLRPWLLLPKVVCVALYVGGLGAAWFVWTGTGVPSLDRADPLVPWTIELVGKLMRFWVVPALLLAILFGVALLLQHPRTFWTLRWLRVKLLLLAVYIPSAHFFLSSRLARLRESPAENVAHSSLATQFGHGLLVALLVAIVVVCIGRLKPRLGQNPARRPDPGPDRGPT